MTYLVTEKCIKCKYTDCVVVCPVDCFHEGENMLVIDPAVCIDCGVCEPECPIGAIVPESPDLIDVMELNHKYSAIWPVITELLEPPKDAEEYKKIENKLHLLSSNPGKSTPLRKK